MNTLTEAGTESHEIAADQRIRTCRAAVLDGRDGETEDAAADYGPDWNIVRGDD